MIHIDDVPNAWLEAQPAAKTLAVQAGEEALHQARVAGHVDIVFADDERVRGLNREFRGKDRPTNVLSFPAITNAEGQLGEIILALETCAREAREQGKTLSAHLQHLVAHGVLHLVGYEHDVDADAEIMEALERRILAALGVADPYA